MLAYYSYYWKITATIDILLLLLAFYCYLWNTTATNGILLQHREGAKYRSVTCTLQSSPACAQRQSLSNVLIKKQHSCHQEVVFVLS